ncbi:MAG: M23 family metallopeptidase [Acidobacteria bacterium]|nr:MAG: M23 family metallopeptidase [Acidobacteriota bacterium]
MIRAAALAAALAAGFGAGAASGGAGLSIEVRARAIAPGEPLRVIVASPVPLEDLRGHFLGRPLSFVASPGGRARWWSWALVPLDADPGPAVIEVSGRTEAGRPVAGARAVDVVARDFPREEIRVAPRYVEPPAGVRERLQRERSRLQRIYARRTAPPGPLGPFVAPVPGEPTSVFGTRRFFNGKPRDPHPGLDLKAARGTPVRASGPGVVALAGDLYYSGNTVIIDHGAGLFTIYAHLDRIEVREGEAVRAGQRIGASGATGRVTGPHLHWGAKIGTEPFDPRALLDPVLF